MGPLNHTPANIVRYALIDEGLGILAPSTPWPPTQTWPIVYMSEPDTPNEVITVFPTRGRMLGSAMHSGRWFEKHGVLIRVRATSDVADTGGIKAQAIVTAIDESIYDRTITIGASRYLIHCFTRTSDVLYLGKQVPDNRRSLFTINTLVELSML